MQIFYAMASFLLGTLWLAAPSCIGMLNTLCCAYLNAERVNGGFYISATGAKTITRLFNLTNEIKFGRTNWLFQLAIFKILNLCSGQSMVAVFGQIMFCGGSIPGHGMNRNTCYAFSSITKNWTQVFFIFTSK